MPSATETNTIVLVTGANQGIGYEIVKKLSAEQPSYHILLGSRKVENGEAALKELGSPSNVEAIQLDLTDDNSNDSCVKHIESKFGRLDVLINNAGTAGRDVDPDFTKLSLRELYTHCYNVNVISAAVLTDKLIPLLKKAKVPRIVFISSSLGSLGQTLAADKILADVPFYNTSKSAMNGLAAYYSKKYENDGFKVNACCPGLNATSLNGFWGKAPHASNGAINAVRLATELDGATGTFTNKEGTLPW